MSDDLFTQAAQAIIDQDRDAAVATAEAAISSGIGPGAIMAKGFVAGIAEVGERFEAGEMFLPELMMAAQAMEGAMEVCNEALGESAERNKGVVVVGTVQGDVHDIGKAIVIAYLKANSFEVHDLGRDCSVDTFLEKAREVEADVIGMSALLTTTMEEQRKLVARLNETGERASFRVVVGGAPCTQRWADQIGADAYAEDASDGVRKILGLVGVVV